MMLQHTASERGFSRYELATHLDRRLRLRETTRSRLHAKAGATHPFLGFAPLWNPHKTKGSVAKTTMRYEGET